MIPKIPHGWIGLYLLLLWLAWRLWYSTQLSGAFVFFNDMDEWMGMDKLGHFTTSFYATAIICGFYPLQKSPFQFSLAVKTALYTSGFWVLLPIEFMDGFSVGYGFSVADALANLVGAVFCGAQLLYWKEVKLFPTFSFYASPYASLRPQLLGHDIFSQCIKDYNGQTYWLLLPMPFKFVPDWCKLAIGYGATGMLGGNSNQWTDSNGVENDYTFIERMPQIYLSVDVDLTKLPVTNAYIFALCKFFNFIKIPLPYISL